MVIVKWEIKCSVCGAPAWQLTRSADVDYMETREMAERFKKIFMEGAKSDDKFLKEQGERYEINLIEAFKEPLGPSMLKRARECPSTCTDGKQACNLVLEFTIEEMAVSGTMSRGGHSEKIN